MSTTDLETETKPCTPHTRTSPQCKTFTHTHVCVCINIATRVIKLQHSRRNYRHLRFSQRYENSSSNATPCSLVDIPNVPNDRTAFGRILLDVCMLPPHWYGLISQKTAIFELAAIIQQGFACCYSIFVSTKKLSKYTNPLFYPFYLDVASLSRINNRTHSAGYKMLQFAANCIPTFMTGTPYEHDQSESVHLRVETIWST